MQNEIKLQLDETINTLQKVRDNLTDTIELIIEKIIYCYKNNGTLYLFGNGGSAADAQHLAAEFVCRFKLERRPLAALALTTDTSFLTACSNDYSFDDIFTRQIEAFVKKNDICIGISTSGNSKNVVNGLKKAKELGAITIAFTGGNGGKIKEFADISFVVPISNTPKIQEAHIAVGHTICDLVEKGLFL